jgi:hypothetical protein
MNVLFFLPPASRGIDTMAEVVLWGRELLKEEEVILGKTQTSLSLSAETSDHLNSAWPPRVPPRIGSNMTVLFCSLLCSKLRTAARSSHGRTGPRQIPDDHGGKSRGGPLARLSLSPFFSSSLGLYCSFQLPSFFHFLPAFLNAALFPAYAS